MKILIVDDEPIIRLGLLFQVEDWGYDALEAANADEAISIIEANPEIKVVLTDVDMPGSMDGIRLAHFVRQKWPPIALIVLSGKLPASEALLPAGARFLSKPVHEEALRKAIDNLTR